MLQPVTTSKGNYKKEPAKARRKAKPAMVAHKRANLMTCQHRTALDTGMIRQAQNHRSSRKGVASTMLAWPNKLDMPNRVYRAASYRHTHPLL
jgi:hypothetical protein